MKIYLALAGALLASAAAPGQTRTHAAPHTKTAPAAAASSATAGAHSALDKATLEAYVRHLLVWTDQIQVTVGDPRPSPLSGFREVPVTGTYNNYSQEEIFYVSDDGKKIVRGTVYDINASPFAHELGLLKTEGMAAQGTPGAPVTLVMFSDFECSYCRAAAKSLHDNLLKTYAKEVEMYYADFPLEQIHPWSVDAAIAGRCIYKAAPDRFWQFHDWIFDKQPEISKETLRNKVTDWAQANSVDTAKLGSCMDTRSTEPEVRSTMALGKALHVNSTPTMFINGRAVPGNVSWDQLKVVIDLELKYKPSTASAEKCCEISLPTPIKK